MSEIRIPTGSSDEVLREFYAHNLKYLLAFQDRQALAFHFLQKYHESLFYYKHFYDNLNEFGNPRTCKHTFYFIPGFNGTPGQIKFGIPSLLKQFGDDIYIKSLYLQEFSCKYPYWLKFTAKNLEKRRRQIAKDLKGLTRQHGKVRVVVSSSGFYDFLAAYPELDEVRDRLVLYWISCAPDEVSPSRWEKNFYRINGFTYDKMKWFAYPNLQWLKFLNPECGTKTVWKNGKQKNIFYKNDLESRFFCYTFLWDYISTDCFNFVLHNNLSVFSQSSKPIDIETHILAATQDGFWDDSSPKNIEKTLSKYIVTKRILYKKTSHLWVVTPDNLSELFAA
ncbi:MAG: hypothetical protein D3923_07705 [Candidatus Electrothrix sp. AR3]|nr:hypothetical protein [Candidatus Electrothrix sp. AR3]